MGLSEITSRFVLIALLVPMKIYGMENFMLLNLRVAPAPMRIPISQCSKIGYAIRVAYWRLTLQWVNVKPKWTLIHVLTRLYNCNRCNKGIQSVALHLLMVHGEAWQVDFMFGIANSKTQR